MLPNLTGFKTVQVCRTSYFSASSGETDAVVSPKGPSSSSTPKPKQRRVNVEGILVALDVLGHLIRRR